jgi:hypothetical protein
MIQLTEKNTAKAVAKARKAKPLVRFVSFRSYIVQNKETGATYTVRFERLNRKPFGTCSCACGRQGQFVCYHIVSALPHHLMMAAQHSAH